MDEIPHPKLKKNKERKKGERKKENKPGASNVSVGVGVISLRRFFPRRGRFLNVVGGEKGGFLRRRGLGLRLSQIGLQSVTE